MTASLKDDRFLADAIEHRLVFTCESCAHYRPADQRCAVMYPTFPHRQSTVDQTPLGSQLWFCKMFEASELD
jgi:hypothetical protein